MKHPSDSHIYRMNLMWAAGLSFEEARDQLPRWLHPFLGGIYVDNFDREVKSAGNIVMRGIGFDSRKL